MFPTIAKYNEAIQIKDGKAFKTLSNLTFIPSRTVPTRIFSYGSGSYAVVFKAKDHSNDFAIRCFISAEKENIERYKEIDNYLKNRRASWITKIELLEDEIKVDGKFYPVLKMDWVDGQLLNNYITQIIHNNIALTSLQSEVLRVSRSLERLKIGHGDIQCGNIIIAKNSKEEYIIKLIDYDGMYIPSFSNKVNLERGRTEFQHPSRLQIQYNEKIDRFSFWVILCAIEALKCDKSLWLEVMQGGFNTLDNLLFIGDDFKYFNNSKLVSRLYSLNNPSLNFYLNKLNNFCNSSPESVELPSLFDSDIFNEDIKVIQPEYQLNSNTSEIQITTNPSGAAVLSSTFQRIGTTPLKIEKEKYLDKTLIISYGTQIKQVIISQSHSIIDLNFSETKDFTTLNDDNYKDTPFQHTLNTIIPPPIQAPELVAATKPVASGSIAFGIIAIIVSGFIIAIFFILPMGKSSNSIIDSTTQSSTYIDTSIVAIDSAMSDQIQTVDTATQRSDVNNGNDISAAYKDDYNLTAKDVIKLFLDALSNSNLDEAWDMTYNPVWENKGKDWFSSYEAFGGVTKTHIQQSYIISQSSTEALLYVLYYAEDSFNGNKCFEQNITIEKFKFPDIPKTKWMITKMKNISSPYTCEVTEY